jgi:hypothetical protein
MNQLMCMSRSGQRVFFIEKAAFDAAEKWYTHTGLATFSSVEPCESMFIDGGGAVFINEPKTEVTANGVTIGVFKRHIPFVIEALQMKDTKITGCVMLSGYGGIYIFTLATRDLLVEELKVVNEACQDEIKELEAKMFEGLSSAGVLALGKCGCQSGMPYANCCGAAGQNLNQNSIME